MQIIPLELFQIIHTFESKSLIIYMRVQIPLSVPVLGCHNKNICNKKLIKQNQNQLVFARTGTLLKYNTKNCNIITFIKSDTKLDSISRGITCAMCVDCPLPMSCHRFYRLAHGSNVGHLRA